MPRLPSRSTREAPILAAVLKLLKWRGVPAWRCNSGALKNPAGRLVRFGAVGMSDVQALVTPTGRLMAIEVKRPGGTPTEAQWAYLRAVQAAGGVALVVDDLDTLNRALDALQADPGAVLGFDGRRHAN